MSEPTVEAFHRMAMMSAEGMVYARMRGDGEMAAVHAEQAFHLELNALRRAHNRCVSLATRKILFDSLMNLAREAFCPELSPPSSDTETEHGR